MKAVIFDLDGTLLDTLEDLYLSTNRALKRFGYNERTKSEVCSFVGNGVGVLIKKALPAEAANYDEVLAEFKDDYSRHSRDNTAPYRGICELLDELKGRNIKCAVVSNKFDGAVKALTREYFDGLIDFACGESESVRRKPAPDTALEALKALNVTNEEAVFVGDSDVDIKTAQAAGLRCVSVLWGFRSREFLLANGATDFISTPSELLKYI